MTITEQIKEVLAHRDVLLKSTEATTCDWVIKPFLKAAGYETFDIYAQSADGGPGIPDYTILPNDEDHTFFLEAKKLGSALQDRDVAQVTGYTHNTGKRWAVLTNGQEWRLYDDHIVGARPPEKLVAVANLDDPEGLERFLKAIGKESVCAGKLDEFARAEAERQRAERVRAALAKTFQLAKPDGDLVRAMHAILAKCEALRELKPDDIVAYFSPNRGLTGVPVIPEPSPEPPGPKGFTDIVNEVLMERGAFKVLWKSEKMIWFLPESVLKVIPRNADPKVWHRLGTQTVSVCCWMYSRPNHNRARFSFECCRTRDKEERLRLVDALKQKGFTFGSGASSLNAKYCRFWMKEWRKKVNLPAKPMEVKRLIESLLDERAQGFKLQTS